MNILLIYRAKEFSPNLANKDKAILDKVGKHLCDFGCNTIFIHEEDFISIDYDVDIVMSMCRRNESLSLLEQFEQRGKIVINSSQSIRNCSRNIIYELLEKADISIAKQYHSNYQFPLWMKTKNGWATTKDDVRYISNDQELKDVKSQNPDKQYLLFEHLKGDLIKFYGVEGSDFFYWIYASENHSKFDLEKYNGKPHYYDFSEQNLYVLCSNAAKAIGLIAYGGDCIVDSNGNIKIIDFNDWPSYSKCIDDASTAIANMALKQIKK